MAFETLDRELPALSHGDHCCLLYTCPEQQARITAPFLGIGLERDEHCVFLGDERSVEAVREGLRDVGIDVEHEVNKGRLVLSSERDYLDGDHWQTEKMLSFLQHSYDSALAARFTALRAVGDMSWQVGPHREFGDLIYYEALLDMFFIGKRLVGMCQYAKDDCPAETLSGILQAHKVAAIDANVCSNFHYVPPDLLVERDEEAREQKRVDWMTSQLLRVKKAEEERDAVQQQLLHAQKMELVGNMAGRVAHDFNNLLTGIIGLSRVVLDNSSLDQEARSDIEEIELAGARGAALTRQLLAFSRRQVLQPRVLSFNDVLRDMERLLARIVGEDIDLELDLAPELGPVKADPGQVEQIIMNLVVNARDAMPEGGTLTLKTGDIDVGEDEAPSHPDLSPGPHVMLAVSDTGCGMDRETQSRIFESFFTTKARSHGTGLGLSTVRGIVRDHGGEILVSSEPEKGSVFEIYFPRIEEDADAHVEPGKRSGSVETREVLDGTETIVVVDDDDTVRRLIERTLADHGYTVLAATRPRDALEFCERHEGTIDLMLTDVLLPGMNGYELTRQVEKRRPGAKVVFMSSHADDAVEQRGILREGRAFVGKPFSPDVVLRKIREVLDG